MAHDVFISYSSRDKTVADAACAKLEADGIRCWIAPRDIIPGMDWGGALIEAIEGARLMLLILSASADESPQILREVERAVNKGLRIIPLRIEDIKPGKSLEYFLGTPHWLDAITPPLERHLEYLAQTVKTLLNNETAATHDLPPPQPVDGKSPARFTRRTLIVGSAIVGAAIAVALLLWFVRRGSAASRFTGSWVASNETGPGKTHFTLQIARDGSYEYLIEYQESGEVHLRSGKMYLTSDSGIERDVGALNAASNPPLPANLITAIPNEVWTLASRFAGVAVAAPGPDLFRQVSDTPGERGRSLWEWYPAFGAVVWRFRLEFTTANYEISVSALDSGQFTADKGFWSASSSVLRTTTGGNYSFVSNDALVMTGTLRGALRTTANGQTLWERTQPVELAQITPRAFPSLAPTPTPMSTPEPSSSPSAQGPAPSPTPKMLIIDKHFIITNDTAIYAKPDFQSATLGNLRRRNRIHATGFLGKWLKIALKNGSEGYIPVGAVE